MRASLTIALVVASIGCHDNTNTYDIQPQLMLIDAAGTYYVGGQPLPRTHLLFTQTRTPSLGGDPQYIDPDFTAVSGCVVNRYDAGGRPIPNTDIDAGYSFYTGYAKNLLVTDGRAAQPAGVYAPPIPDRINCNKSMLKPYIDCWLGDMNGLGQIDGKDPLSVWFPPVPPAVWSAMCPNCGACDMQQVPGGAGGMTAVCEQHPLPMGTVVTEDLSGGGGYAALTNQALPPVGGAGNLKIVRVTVGGADVSGVDAITLDATKDISLQWNCDPSATNLVPSPAGCPSSAGAATHLLAVYALSSMGARSQFLPGTAYSALSCFNPVDDPRATLTIAKEGLQTLLGNSAASVMLVVAQVDVEPVSSLDHSVFLGAGRGQFVLLSTGAAPPDMSVVMDAFNADLPGTD
jgi:hypothetical protein